MEEQKQPESFIQVIFSEVGSTIFNAQIGSVTPLQVLALAHYLQFIGEAGLAKQEMDRQAAEQRNKIMVPGINAK